MVFLYLPNEEPTFHIDEVDGFFSKVEHHNGISFDFVRHIQRVLHLIIAQPYKNLILFLLTQADLDHLFLQCLSPMLAIVEHLD